MRIPGGLGISCFCTILFTVATNSVAEADTPTSASMPTVVPVHQLREGRHVLGFSQKYLQEFPPWVNRTLLELGQRFVRQNFHAFAYSIEFTGFLLGADARRVFISGGNTTDPNKAARRFLANSLNLWYWATAELGSPELFEALNLIHAVHAKMGYETNCRYKMFEKPLIPEPNRGRWSGGKGGPFKVNYQAWDALQKDLGANRPLQKLRRSLPEFPPRNGGTRIPFNQFGMANQQWAGVAYAVMAPHKVMIGSEATDEELMGAVHFWAFIGRGLGLEDRYNVCLQPDLPTTRAYFRRMLYEYVAPRFFEIPYEQRVFMEGAIKGTSRILSFGMAPLSIERAAVGLVLYRLCSDLFGIDCPHLRKVMKPIAHVGSHAMDHLVLPITRFDAIKSVANTGIEGLLLVQAQRMYGHHFHFNGSSKTETDAALARGLVGLNNEILQTSSVHWKGAPKCTESRFTT